MGGLHYIGLHCSRSENNSGVSFIKRGSIQRGMLTGSGSNRTTEDEDEVADFWSKCMPMLLFGLVACTLNKSQLSSLDFTINRFFYETVSD